MVHVQVQAAVIQPERLLSRVTNTFNFLFSVELRRDDSGRQLPLMEVVPGTGEVGPWRGVPPTWGMRLAESLQAHVHPPPRQAFDDEFPVPPCGRGVELVLP